MPIEMERGTKWGDLDDDEEVELPPISVKVENGIKTVIEYRITADGKKEKVTRQYKVAAHKRKVPVVVLQRRQWAKFGECRNEPPGPNPNNTSITDDVFLVLTSQKEDLDKEEGEEDLKAKIGQAKNVQCRICKGQHFTLKCPYKDNFGAVTADAEAGAGDEAKPAQGALGAKSGKYVPPSMREGAKRTEGTSMRRQVDDAATIRVTNLSEETRDADLKELFSPFGTITRIFLAKDKNTQQSKGFAFISYLRKEDAEKAIRVMNGKGHDYLILNVEWSKPSGNQ